MKYKSEWLIEQIEAGVDWPEYCVAFPWPKDDRRQAAYLLGRQVPASHISLHFKEGPRPSMKHQALHSCDNRYCINANHLRWGLELENRLDQVERQRGSIGKIGLDTARLVRAELESVADKYQIDLLAIQRIAGGVSWNEESWKD